MKTLKTKSNDVKKDNLMKLKHKKQKKGKMKSNCLVECRNVGRRRRGEQLEGGKGADNG